MGVFRKKAVVIEAIQLRDDNRTLLQSRFMPNHKTPLIIVLDGNGVIDHAEITTLEGIHRGDVGDWIIKGVQGELYPCKPDIFAATYEAVEE